MRRYRFLSSRMVLLSMMLILFLLSGWQSSMAEDPNNPIGLNKKVLLILLDWQNLGVAKASAPRHDALTYENVLETRVNDYYKLATYNKTTFDLVVPVNPDSEDGWWRPTYHYDQYYGIWATDPVKAPPGNKGPIVQDAMNLVSGVVDVTQFSNVLLIGNVKEGGGQASQFIYNGKLYNGSTTAEMGSDLELTKIVAHELGHTIGLPDLYCNGVTNRCTLGNYGLWDLMDNHFSFNHFSGWSKVDRGWIEPDMIQSIPIGPQDPAVSEQVLITPISRPSLAPAYPNVVRLPVYEGPPFYGYYLECRRPGNGESDIPEEGILVTLVDETKTETLCQAPARVVWPFAAGDHCDAALGEGTTMVPGESYYNDAVGFSVHNIGRFGDTCVAQIVYEPTGEQPDPAITREVEVYQYTQYSLFESPDIWVDSQKNGWNNYPAYQALDGDGAPIGPGDVPWKDHKNRVYFRVKNAGSSVAANVQVDVSVIQPLVIYGPCGNSSATETAIGSVAIPTLDPGETYIDYVEWTPPSEQLGKFLVRVLPIPGELTYANNYAEATVHFPFTGVVTVESQPVTIHQAIPTKNICDFPIQINTVPATGFPPAPPDPTDWIVAINPAIQLFGAGEPGRIEISAETPSIARAGSRVEIPLTINTAPAAEFLSDLEGTPELFATMTLQMATVAPSSISCELDADRIEPGDRIRLSGRLDPPLGNEVVALEYTTPFGASVVRNLVSDENGAFSEEFLFRGEGLWRVKSYWGGSAEFAAAQSRTCFFILGDYEGSVYLPALTAGFSSAR